MNADIKNAGQIEIKDIRHVLDLLISHLYGGDPHLTVRELIQNAHDAIVSKYDVGHRKPFYADEQITIEVDPFVGGNGYLEITDSGTGMTGDELRENLGKIGDSSKLAAAVHNPAIIGRFGIGFLSSFIVAERVDVTTRSVKSSEVWRWSTSDKANWVMKQVGSDQMPKPGTRVRLHFSNTYSSAVSKRIHDLQGVDGLRKLVERFAYLLPIPIKIQRSGERGVTANAVRPPWGSEADAANAASVLLPNKDQPLHIHRFERKESNYSASGVLYFRPQLTFNASMRLYVRRMLVDEEDTSLLPDYALFATGFVDSPSPDVDLARRNVSQFDPAYQWLRRVVREEFERAFIDFATQSSDTLAVKLWPRVDNSFITRLLHSSQSDDELEKTAAISFLLQASRFMPFYLLDTISGGFGQPTWKTIDSMVRETRGRASTAGSRDQKLPVKVVVPYTNSSAPIEKDFLVQAYSEVIDVGREEKAHGQLMEILTGYNDQFPDFELCRVTADRFTPLPPGEVSQWVAVVDLVQGAVIFRGREHRVLVELFEPVTNAVTITDTEVDEEEANRFREALSGVGSSGLQGELARMMTEFLDRAGSAGGLITIHINAGNAMMVRLREAMTSPNHEIVSVAGSGLQQTVWRAVLDYFGWRSTRDMINRERVLNVTMMNELLDRTETLQQVRERLTQAENNRQALEDQNAILNQKLAAMEEEPQDLGNVIVGFIDIVSSTETVMMNALLAPEQRDALMIALIKRLQKQLDGIAQPISFTGDGLLFHFKAGTTGVCLPHLRTLADALDLERGNFPAMAPFLANKGMRLRIALSWGPVRFDRIGPSNNLVGWPVVEAARLAAAKDFYPDGQVSIVATELAVTAGIQAGLWRNGDWERITGQWQPRGFNGSAAISRHTWC
ncbi:ATP-binding protein [Insolitispirillum peregrinum]|uniref:Histidine kinase-, DNA gyrase B-, and HSP90-like ATPase n=1 Tax=Insolitispirillum peregrinum TaxID=80876 RepID=A0A1N7MTI3_9PROT|nr:ATP-binding protein [Insolitispirillum peregrinum]SIS89390.1 Histidine kinase-, DNA gyrase B-, and HSP90-like ATPase [Insolitispirillum peregrinum]